MKSTSWIPLTILVLVVLSIGFSWYLTEPDREYLFDGERGLPRSEVRNWWTYKLPVTVSVGLIATLISLTGLRSLRSGDLRGAVGLAAVGALGLLALAAANLYIGVRNAPPPEPAGLPTPQTPGGVFLWSQWHDLAKASEHWAEYDWDDMGGELRADGIGLDGRPGLLPFDPFLLERLSFLGLTVAEVEELLGPRYLHSDISYEQGGMAYLMRGYRSFATSRAMLSLALDGPPDDRTSVVRGEYLRIIRFQY